jgi:signal peptidase I
MNYFARRRLKKAVRHVLHEARHVRNMREDIADPAHITELEERRDRLHQAYKARQWDQLEALAGEVVETVGKIYPPGSISRVRENIEVIVVALAVALAFRTYFVQPFKIPTGSMQPTLYGITFHEPSSFSLFNHYPLRLVNFALFGEYPVRLYAPATGHFHYRGEGMENYMITGPGRGFEPKVKMLDTSFHAYDYQIENTQMKIPIPAAFKQYVQNGDFVEKGQLLAAGTIRLGDHIFVNKVRYNFVRPERGDIIVFDTQAIDYPGIKTNTFYIKRLVGLPGERVSINTPDDPRSQAERYLVINGTNAITQPYPFERLLTEEGYVGYLMAGSRNYTRRPALAEPGDEIVLNEDQFLPFGDNTRQSLDGRFFGGVEREHLVGPAFAIYWPLSKRWGLTR